MTGGSDRLPDDDLRKGIWSGLQRVQKLCGQHASVRSVQEPHLLATLHRVHDRHCGHPEKGAAVVPHAFSLENHLPFFPASAHRVGLAYSSRVSERHKSVSPRPDGYRATLCIATTRQPLRSLDLGNNMDLASLSDVGVWRLSRRSPVSAGTGVSPRLQAWRLSQRSATRKT